MSMINLCDILGAFISGHLQRYFHAYQIGLGCAVFILGALISISITMYRKERERIGKLTISKNITVGDTNNTTMDEQILVR